MSDGPDLTTSGAGTPIAPVAPVTPGTSVQAPSGGVASLKSSGGQPSSGSVTIESQEGMRTVIAALRKYAETVQAAKKAGESALAQVQAAGKSPDSGEPAVIYSGVTDAVGKSVSNVNSNLSVIETSAGALADQLEHVLNSLNSKDEDTARKVQGTQV